MSFATGTSLGPYKIISLIGSGGWERSIARATLACCAMWR
jgi:hypothetical protein